MRCTLLALLVFASPIRAAGPPDFATSSYGAADAQASPVSEANLLASERFWPYHVELTKPAAPGGRALQAGTRGVLIRVEPLGLARIDFGRDGVQRVPVTATDLVAEANRVRLGELDKIAQNFVLAVGPRLVASDGEAPRPLRLEDVMEYGHFLCVFSDLEPKSLAALARALSPLAERPGLLTIVFPQGEYDEGATARALAESGWPVPFLPDHLAESYTQTLLDSPKLPSVLLQTAEGRVLFESAWNDSAAPKLLAAVELIAGKTLSAIPSPQERPAPVIESSPSS